MEPFFSIQKMRALFCGERAKEKCDSNEGTKPNAGTPQW